MEERRDALAWREVVAWYGRLCVAWRSLTALADELGRGKHLVLSISAQTDNAITEVLKQP